MEITGKLYQLLDPQSGKSARGEWKKQDFIIETEEQFPKKICISNWNDKIDLNSVKTGEFITLDINLESREFNGKWYTDVKAWRMQKKSADIPNTASAADGFAPPPSADDVPWDDASEDGDDLPF